MFGVPGFWVCWLFALGCGYFAGLVGLVCGVFVFRWIFSLGLRGFSGWVCDLRSSVFEELGYLDSLGVGII